MCIGLFLKILSFEDSPEIWLYGTSLRVQETGCFLVFKRHRGEFMSTLPQKPWDHFLILSPAREIFHIVISNLVTLQNRCLPFRDFSLTYISFHTVPRTATFHKVKVFQGFF